MDNSLFKDFTLRSKNMLITAKTRTGVTSSIMVPAVLENNETNFVILDFNKEIYFITNKYRRKYGNVYFIDRDTTIEDIFTGLWAYLISFYMRYHRC